MRIVASLVLFALLGACTANSTSPAPSAPSMPPFSKEFAKDARDLYHISWTKDGYPAGRKPDGSLYAHPLYGVYALNDYLEQYATSHTVLLKRAIRRVAYASARRMRSFRKALVFWYEATPEFSRAYRRYYSGLTQSYYAIAFHQAGRILKDDDLIHNGSRAFDALLVPEKEGGVLYHDIHGISVAEVPQEPNSYILNGWISALFSVRKYAALSGSPKAKNLVSESVKAMIGLLPLYDIPDLANSRYGLTGPIYVRVVSSGTQLHIRAASVIVPGEGSFSVPKLKSPSTWQNHLLDDQKANIVLSRASYPQQNQLRLSLEADDSGSATLQAYVSETYNPRYSAPTDETWQDLDHFTVAQGRQTVTLALPWAKLNLVGYPTDFGRKVDGNHMNFYHSIHITQLQALAEATGRDELARWSKKWMDYQCRWKDLDVYKGLWASTPDERRVPVTDIC